MPPANTPAPASPSPTPPHPSPPPPPGHDTTRSLTPLSYLSSPVADLASTLQLGDQEADAEEENARFLRESVDLLERITATERNTENSSATPASNPAASASNIAARNGTTSREQWRPQPNETPEDLSRRERLQRVLARLNRVHDPSSTTPTAYSNRTPSPNRQSLYDWAPSAREAERPQMDNSSELDAILNELRRSHSDLQPLGETARQSHAAEGVERRDRLRDRERRRREQEWVNLRQRAAAQSRASRQGSPSATDRMLRYVMERERSGLSEEEERVRGQGWFRPSPNRGESGGMRQPDAWLLPPPAASESRRVEGERPPESLLRELRERDRQERVEAFRRGYLAENVPQRIARNSTPPVRENARVTAAAAAASSSAQNGGSSTSSSLLKNALKYLSELRDCTSYEQALETAIDHGLGRKEFFADADRHEDFVMDLGEIDPLPDSSWLQAGSVFEGHQHASSNTVPLTHRSPFNNAATSHNVEQINTNFEGSTTTTFDPSRTAPLPPFDATRPWLSHQFSPPTSAFAKHFPDPQHDHWPVRVIIHTVDKDTMSIQGTMEAYDVPQHIPSLSLLSTSSTDGNTERLPKAGKKSAPITTYVEGHIIDLRTHSFLTPIPESSVAKPSPTSSSSNTANTTPSLNQTPQSLQPTASRNAVPSTTYPQTTPFPISSPATDAANWLRLPPFSSILSASPTSTTSSSSASEALAHLLLSNSALNALHQEYIFMRWKERCFVHRSQDTCSASREVRAGDADREHGLTISGFYYVSLRRSDGEVEGLYFDPGSTPFQHLRLRGRMGGWGAWGVR